MQIVHGAVVIMLLQPVAGNFISQLWSLAESEQRFVATDFCALLGDLENLLWRQVWIFEAGGRLGECAVSAFIATQHGERYENFRRKCDATAECLIANFSGELHQLGG